MTTRYLIALLVTGLMSACGGGSQEAESIDRPATATQADKPQAETESPAAAR